MKTRRYLTLFIAIAMIFAMCSYASAASGKAETTEETTAATEDELKLMNAVLDGMIIWYEENYEPIERSEFFTVYDELLPVDIIISGSISFSDIEAAAEK